MSEEHKKTKEDELIEYARRRHPNLRVRKATEEERARFGERRIYVGSHPPVAKMPKRDEDNSR